MKGRDEELTWISLYLVKKTQDKKRGSSIILFLELLHTGDEKLEQKKKIWETAEINLCSQSLRVKKFNHIYNRNLLDLYYFQLWEVNRHSTPPSRLI